MANEYLQVGLPKNINVNHTGMGLEVTRRWFSPKYIFLVFFAIFWNGFMIFWFYNAIKSGHYEMALFGALHAIVGIGLIYTVLSGFLNKTHIVVDQSHLTIAHRPLPWLGNKNIKSYDLKQLYSKEKVGYSQKGSARVSYEIHAITRDDRNIKILSGLDSSEQALFIEQEIEKYLNIEDKKVRGEIPR